MTQALLKFRKSYGPLKLIFSPYKSAGIIQTSIMYINQWVHLTWQALSISHTDMHKQATVTYTYILHCCNSAAMHLAKCQTCIYHCLVTIYQCSFGQWYVHILGTTFKQSKLSLMLTITAKSCSASYLAPCIALHVSQNITQHLKHLQTIRAIEHPTMVNVQLLLHACMTTKTKLWF